MPQFLSRPLISVMNQVRRRTPPSLSTQPKIFQPLTETQLITQIHASKSLNHLQQLLARTIRHNQFSNTRVTTQLITTSSKLNSISYALSIFQSIHNPNLFLYNNLIRALTDNSYFMSSISYFLLMLRSNIRPNRLTFPFVLKSSASLVEGWLGREIHGGVVKLGFEFDLFVRISLADMYVKVDLVGLALQVFEESPDRNEGTSVLLWNVLINGCCKVGRLEKAVELFEAMPARSSVSWSSLVNGLMMNGESERALGLFCRAPEKDVVLWTTMVHGFSQNGYHDKALSMFFKMLEEGVRPNDLTIVSALLACTKAGALETGERIHKFMSRAGFKLSRGVGTALVDMFAKCGSIESASRIFAQLKEKDLRTWTVMIWGWAIHGRVEQALQCFKKMKSTGIKPDEVAFLAILTACLHAGKVDQGLQLFDTMTIHYSFEPTMKHYAVVVDLFGRAGRLDEALSFIEDMPLDPDLVVWGSIFCACRAHKNIKMAEYACEKLLQLEPEHPGSYVFLSNIYAAVGKWEDVGRVRTIMKNRGVEKDPGWSYVEIKGQVNSFVAGDHAHARSKEIYEKLEEITRSAREQGYLPETEWVLHNIEEEEKEDALGSHSEKLALALGLICTAPGMSIRIVKNLRICGDCHAMMKYASKMTRRELVVRDIKRFHHFKDGTCSCQDHW